MKVDEVKMGDLSELIAKVNSRDTHLACFGRLFFCFSFVFVFRRNHEVFMDEVVLFDTESFGPRNLFRFFRVATKLIEASIGECDQHGRIPFRMTFQAGSRKRTVEVLYRSAATISMVLEVDGTLDDQGSFRRFTEEEKRALREGRPVNIGTSRR